MINQFKSPMDVGWLRINTLPIKSQLMTWTSRWIDMFINHLKVSVATAAAAAVVLLQYVICFFLTNSHIAVQCCSCVTISACIHMVLRCCVNCVYEMISSLCTGECRGEVGRTGQIREPRLGGTGH